MGCVWIAKGLECCVLYNPLYSLSLFSFHHANVFGPICFTPNPSDPPPQPQGFPTHLCPLKTHSQPDLEMYSLGNESMLKSQWLKAG